MNDPKLLRQVRTSYPREDYLRVIELVRTASLKYQSQSCLNFQSELSPQAFISSWSREEILGAIYSVKGVGITIEVNSGIDSRVGPFYSSNSSPPEYPFPSLTKVFTLVFWLPQQQDATLMKLPVVLLWKKQATSRSWSSIFAKQSRFAPESKLGYSPLISDQRISSIEDIVAVSGIGGASLRAIRRRRKGITMELVFIFQTINYDT